MDTLPPRWLLRTAHVAVALLLGVVVYAPASATADLRLVLAVAGIPLATLSGILLWQQGRLRRRPALAAGLAALVAAGAAAGAPVVLQQTFATVRHPVSLGAANTEFSAATVRAWYRTLIAQGTLDEMVRTEIVDLLWIVCLAAAVVLLTMTCGLALRRRSPVIGRRLRHIAPWTALAPALDLAENAVSLTMLAQAPTFWEPLAAVHAGISWTKLAMLVVTVTAVAAWTLKGIITRGEHHVDPVPPRRPEAGAVHSRIGTDRG